MGACRLLDVPFAVVLDPFGAFQLRRHELAHLVRELDAEDVELIGLEERLRLVAPLLAVRALGLLLAVARGVAVGGDRLHDVADAERLRRRLHLHPRVRVDVPQEELDAAARLLLALCGEHVHEERRERRRLARRRHPILVV